MVTRLKNESWLLKSDSGRENGSFLSRKQAAVRMPILRLPGKQEIFAVIRVILGLRLILNLVHIDSWFALTMIVYRSLGKCGNLPNPSGGKLSLEV
jgi:hypothetical protein